MAITITQADTAAINRSKVTITGGSWAGSNGYVTGSSYDSVRIRITDTNGNFVEKIHVSHDHVQLIGDAEKTPKTIATLINQVKAQGGYAEKVEDRVWEFYIARRSVQGNIFQTCVARVGYYVGDDGRNKIGRGVHEVRSWLKHCPPVK